LLFELSYLGEQDVVTKGTVTSNTEGDVGALDVMLELWKEGKGTYYYEQTINNSEDAEEIRLWANLYNEDVPSSLDDEIKRAFTRYASGYNVNYKIVGGGLYTKTGEGETDFEPEIKIKGTVDDIGIFTVRFGPEKDADNVVRVLV